jgi:outer membrane protein assembly factor BamE (lipoprotein component of BamABCDE complex)
MKSNIAIFLTLLVCLHITGCTASRSGKEDLYSQHREWDAKTLDKVAQGVIEIGMTKEQVREALGHKKIFDLKIEGDRWSYGEDKKPGRQEEVQSLGKILIFKNDRLVQMRSFLRNMDNTFYMEW